MRMHACMHCIRIQKASETQKKKKNSHADVIVPSLARVSFYLLLLTLTIFFFRDLLASGLGPSLHAHACVHMHAGVSIPELGLTMAHGSLGGKFTSVEGTRMRMHTCVQGGKYEKGGNTFTPFLPLTPFLPIPNLSAISRSLARTRTRTQACCRR